MTLIQVGVACLLAFSVLAHGAVEAWSIAILEIGAAMLFLLWGVLSFRDPRMEITWSPLFWPMLGFGGFVFLQWVLGLSVYPYLTKIEWLKLAAYFLLFFLAVQSFRRPQEIRNFAWFLVVFGFAVALFGILQFFSFNQKLYWFREYPAGSPFGPFVNRNHFAGFMEMIIPLGMAIFFLRAVRKEQLPLVGLFTVIPIGALFLSGSRGGITSFLCEVALLGFLLLAFQKGRKKVAVVAVIILLAGVFVFWLGIGQSLERFAHFTSEGVTSDNRMGFLKDGWRIFLDHPWVGTGLGTIITVYPQYASAYDGRIVNHLHNDYVEVMAETGLIGSIWALLFLLLLFWFARPRSEVQKDPFHQAVRMGAVVGCAGLLVHSLVDFNFHIPSNALLFFLLSFLATATLPAIRQYLPSNPREGKNWLLGQS